MRHEPALGRSAAGKPKSSSTQTSLVRHVLLGVTRPPPVLHRRTSGSGVGPEGGFGIVGSFVTGLGRADGVGGAGARAGAGGLDLRTGP